MHLCVRSIDFTSFNDFAIWFLNCSDSVILLFLFIFLINSDDCFCDFMKWAWSKGYYWQSKLCFLSWPWPWNRNGGILKTKLYDKHDDITFPIVNFPFNSSSLLPLVKITIDSSSISASPSYGVYISQLMRYSWACAQYIDFLDRYQLLTQKLLKQKFYCRHHNHRYEISISQMTIDHLLFT